MLFLILIFCGYVVMGFVLYCSAVVVDDDDDAFRGYGFGMD